MSGASRPIIGYRSWKINEANGWLQPPHFPTKTTPWKPRGLAVAVCHRTEKEGIAPAHTRCFCGLYGHFDFRAALVKEGESSQVDVLGVFVGFGRMSIHESGFRAGKGRIVALTHKGSGRAKKTEVERIRHIADLYEVPYIGDRRKLKQEASRWGEHRKVEESDSVMPTSKFRSSPLVKLAAYFPSGYAARSVRALERAGSPKQVQTTPMVSIPNPISPYTVPEDGEYPKLA